MGCPPGTLFLPVEGSVWLLQLQPSYADASAKERAWQHQAMTHSGTFLETFPDCCYKHASTGTSQCHSRCHLSLPIHTFFSSPSPQVNPYPTVSLTYSPSDVSCMTARASYRSGIHQFQAICHKSKVTALPATQQTVMYFAACVSSPPPSPPTIKVYL